MPHSPQFGSVVKGVTDTKWGGTQESPCRTVRGMATEHPPNALKKLREERGWSQPYVAEQLGMSLSGYIKLERSERGMKADRLAAAVKLFQVPQREITLIDEPELQVHPHVYAWPEPSNQPTAQWERPPSFSYHKVLGTLSAGVFKDAELFGDELDEVVAAPPNHRYPWARQLAWRVEGDSMDEAQPKPIRNGDYVIGIAYEDVQEAVTLRSGMNVVVRQTTDNGQTYEMTVKELRLLDDKAEFVPRSSNKKHRVISVPRDLTADDGRKVEILAIVQYVFDNHDQTI